MAEKKIEFQVRAVLEVLHYSFMRDNIDEAKILIKRLVNSEKQNWSEIELYQLTKINIKALTKKTKSK